MLFQALESYGNRGAPRSCCLLLEGRRAEVPDRGMSAPAIVESLDVVNDLVVGLSTAVEHLASDQLLLQGRQRNLSTGALS